MAKERKTVITFGLPADALRRVDEAARQNNRSRSNMLAVMIDIALGQIQNVPGPGER